MADIDVIIDKILADAEIHRQAQVEKASEQARVLVEKAVKEGEVKLGKSLKDGEQEKAATISRAQTVAKLEAGKLMLGAKQELITRAFELARERILALPTDEYKRFLSKFLARYAEDGDIVVLSAYDKSRFTEDDIKAMSGGKSVKLSKDQGNFKGGAILLSKNFDKNITLSAILSQLREAIEDKVANILFKAPPKER